jgi:hypothetical protein
VEKRATALFKTLVALASAQTLSSIDEGEKAMQILGSLLSARRPPALQWRRAYPEQNRSICLSNAKSQRGRVGVVPGTLRSDCEATPWMLGLTARSSRRRALFGREWPRFRAYK